MVNPLALPSLLLGAAAAVPRAVEAIARTPDLLERAVEQAAGLNASADDARELLTAGLERIDAVNGRADQMLEELAEARAVFAEAMLKLDRLGDQGDAVMAAIERTRPTAEEIAGRAQPMIDAAVDAREQLRETQAVLERASEQFERALGMAEPFDRMTARAARLAGTLRRDADPPTSSGSGGG